eukprot:6187076-Pleurochrysis_carterae.AAC.1
MAAMSRTRFEIDLEPGTWTVASALTLIGRTSSCDPESRHTETRQREVEHAHTTAHAHEQFRNRHAEWESQ